MVQLMSPHPKTHSGCSGKVCSECSSCLEKNPSNKWHTIFLLDVLPVIQPTVSEHYTNIFIHIVYIKRGLQCFDAVGWAAGRAAGL